MGTVPYPVRLPARHAARQEACRRVGDAGASSRAGRRELPYSVAMHRPPLAALAVGILLAGALAACAPTPAPTGAAPSPSTSTVTDPPTGTTSPSPTVTPSPSSTEETVAALPTDCRAILSADVLSQLKDVPLNDPAFAPTGVRADGSLMCVWRHPGADTTGITTTIARVARGPALAQLNELRDAGATCYTPSRGTRCERTWPDEQYPVMDGRTMFWRAGVMIDTVWSNLAPVGYTASIIAHVFP